jgi:hypothetical protein
MKTLQPGPEVAWQTDEQEKLITRNIIPSAENYLIYYLILGHQNNYIFKA